EVIAGSITVTDWRVSLLLFDPVSSGAREEEGLLALILKAGWRGDRKSGCIVANKPGICRRFERAASEESMSPVPPPSFGPDDVEILQTDTCHEGHLRVQRLLLRCRRYEGGWSAPFSRELLLREQGVGVLLY